MKPAAADLFVSVVAPLHDDGDIVDAFVDETMRMLSEGYTNYELVLVDDGSRDDTVERASAQLRRYSCIRLIRLSRRFGQETAISAGLDSVIGDYVAVVLPDSDPPGLVPALVERSRSGTGIVFGIRRNRRGEPLWLRFGAGLFYGICNRLLGLQLPRNSTHFRVLSRQALNAVVQVKDRTRYLRTLSAYVGYGNQGFEYDPATRRQPPRHKSVVESITLAINIVVANSTRPLRLVTWLAMLISGLYLLYMGYIVLIYLLKPRVAEGWVTLSLQSAVAFFFLFLILTVLSEYLGRLLGEVKEGPLYYVLEERNSSVLIADEERRNVVGHSVESDR
jgi:glycosyltransferase involved in cell wall biosynthesis